MNLIALDIATIPLGQPLPFALRAAGGALLAQQGYVIRDRAELDALVQRGLQLCVDTDASGASYRAYLAQLQQMLLAQNALGEIAGMQLRAGAQARERAPQDGPPDWPDLQLRATQLLRAPQAGDFLPRLHALHQELALVHLSAQETRMYSATHALLVCCVCTLVARETLAWPAAQVAVLGLAALTMNLAMTTLQDRLALQKDPLGVAQVDAVQRHAAQSEALLRELGVQDADWLAAVREHHQRAPGPLAARSEAGRMARLLQRADLFGARIAPRATRVPLPVTTALQGCYHDEERQADEAGAALVKTLGLYPPGTCVRLASQEVAVVLRRGASATTPRVAALRGRDGLALSEPIPRDTALDAYKIIAPVAQRELRVTPGLERLLAL